MIYKTIRHCIKETREKKAITQKEMAERLFMDERSYQRLESGEKKFIDVGLLLRISEILEIDFLKLIKR